jgi:hypothetical protein
MSIALTLCAEGEFRLWAAAGAARINTIAKAANTLLTMDAPNLFPDMAADLFNNPMG